MNRSFISVRLWHGLIAATMGLLAGCGGGGSSGGSNTPAVSAPPVSGQNVQAVRVGSGPAGLNVRVANLLYTSVRLCVPGTTTCQTIDHVLVDTGSTGLRLLRSAVNLPLAQALKSGKPLYNCVQFVDQSYMWGPVVEADVHMGGTQLDGQTASNLRIQLAGSFDAPPAPDDCAHTDLTPSNTVNDLGANGILGVGMALQDCSADCTSNSANARYHVRNGDGSTSGTTVLLTEQLHQPVSQFSAHNNGTIIQLPAVAANGADSASGYMIFGIGTASNNQPATATVLTPNPLGYFTTTFKGRVLSQGFVDSGSNGWFFGTLDAPDYTLCSNAPQWYCPSSTRSEQARNSTLYGQTSTVDFSVANANSLFNNRSAHAYSNLAGPTGDNQIFDFGLPFFYGRSVITAIDGRATTNELGAGPYVAY